MTIPGFLKSVEDLCVAKSESWWTYEICLGKSIKQVHYSFTVLRDERGDMRQSQHADVTFSLGVLPTGGIMNEGNRILNNMRENSTDLDPTMISEQMQVTRLLKGFGATTAEHRHSENSGAAASGVGLSGMQPSIQLEYTGGTPCTGCSFVTHYYYHSHAYTSILCNLQS